jgi:hypothetical protein
LPDSLDDLRFSVFPPAIDISTPANPQIFNPQFGVANISATDTVSLTSAVLLVPVTTTNGTNLAQNTDMTSNAITSGWGFNGDLEPPPGYVAFDLLPNDGIGEIPPGGSVAFTLSGVKVNTVPGTATLQLSAEIAINNSPPESWTPTAQITLTQPNTIPTITRYSIKPNDPQTLTTLQGQPVVLTWTTSGAAYCMIEDDQANILVDPSTKTTKLPTSGTIADTPVQGNSPPQSTGAVGHYYSRSYTLYAISADATQLDEKSNLTFIRLPTIVNFSVAPASLAIGEAATVTWSVVNIDPDRCTITDPDRCAITLTLAPTDGTGPYTLSIPPNQLKGSGVVTPTPLTTTTYALQVDNGYGVTCSSSPQTVTSPLQPGWQEMGGLETLGNARIPAAFGLVAFGLRRPPLDFFGPSTAQAGPPRPPRGISTA